MIENKRDSFTIDDASLKLLSCNLDSDQLQAVKETENVVVSAGAGSGKTTVLASRYAYLVEAKNVPCEKILTLTFTKKAATEMKGRIFNGLKYHLHGKDIKGKNSLPADFPHLAEIKKRAQTAIESFDRAHIQTLDSYFSEIAKKGAHYYGITPNFSLDDEKIASKIRYNATKYVLEHLEAEEIKEIAQIFQIQNVAEELFAKSVLKYSTILKPVDFDESLRIQKNRLIEDYSLITSKIEDEIGALICLPKNPKPSATLEKLYSYMGEAGNPETPVLDESAFESREKAKSFLDGQFLPYCRKVSNYCGGDFSRVGDDGYKTSKKILLPLLEKLYLIANSVSAFDLQKKVYAHLKEFQEQMIKTKRVSGLLTFADVSELALRTLIDHEEIRAVEKQKFDAIMIDEFQDDNSLQCDVLLILSDKNEKFDPEGRYLLPRLSDSDLHSRLDTHKLFFVGDDKQSIYRFRGADVSVFRSLSSSIKKTIPLKTNYRSAPELICGFNTIFGGYDYPAGREVNEKLPAVFMTAKKFSPNLDGTPRIPDYEADYKLVEVPEKKLSQTDFSEKKITVALYPEDAEPSVAEGEVEAERKVYECEASFVAREIKKLLEEKDENGEKKYHCRDIALLFRSATPTPLYENVLLANGIPYSTEVYKGFFSDGPINDIISLLKLCVYPEDKNAWAKLLRSPFCTLTFAQMEEVLVNTENPYKQPFGDEMLEKISGNAELSAKILALKNLYEDINSRLKNEKLTKTISYIWYELGYRYETMWNKAVSMYASFYDILFEMARLAEQKTQSLAAFIDMVKSYEDSDGKLDGLDVVMDREDTVQILTIHKSKGLEFKVVFVCAVSSKGVVPANAIDYDGELGFLLKTPSWGNYLQAAEKLPKTSTVCKNASKNYFFSVVAERSEKQESAELRRVAYVALTRAEDRLYIVGNSNSEFEDEKKSRRFEFDSGEESEIEYAEPKNIYQLLLPILFESNCEGGVKNPSFNFVNDPESFAAASIEETEKAEKTGFIKNLQEIKTDGIVEEKLSPKVYVSPSKLKAEKSREAELPFDFEQMPANPEYELINKIVASTVPVEEGKTPVLKDEGEEAESGLTEPLFTFANFGTIAHAYMEGKVLGKEPVISEREWLGVNERFIPNVAMESWTENKKDSNRDKKIAKIRALCNDMAEKFEVSSIYKEVSVSPWKKTEYSFRSLIENAEPPADGEDYAKDLIVSGQIDLVYQNESGSPYKYTIVDYKTNQTVEPQIYYTQLSCYRKAISQMLGCKESEIRCVLYYLRYAKEVDITKNC